MNLKNFSTIADKKFILSALSRGSTSDVNYE